MINFYVWDSATDPVPPSVATPDLRVEIWRPNWTSLWPGGLPAMPYAIWWAFHCLHIFANRECGVLSLWSGQTLVHSSLVTPRYFRFPEMSSHDIQIGATYTAPTWRGRGIARAAIGLVRERWFGRFEKIWYLVGSDNIASIKVVEACGFKLRGTGKRVARYKIGVLGQYRIISK